MLDAEQKMKLLISDRPWEHEPDNEEWVHDLTGYKCTIWRHPTFGHLNGYVAIPKGHRCHGKHYDNLDVEVHGGLTYSEQDKETDEWVVGFDCSHAGDMSPKLMLTLLKYTEADTETIEFKMRSERYRTFAWVKEEVCSLARQLKLLNMKQGEEK
jgi:hypothetical protein